MSNRTSTAKKAAFYTILMGLTIAGCLALLEFGLARYYHSTEDQLSTTMFDPVRGWRLRPGTYWVKPGHAFREHALYINEDGLRNRDLHVDSHSETERLIILGDSFTFAVKTPSESTFPVLLEQHLNGKAQYEVINAGVPAYGTAQEMLFMKELTAKNIVGNVYVLMIFTNDILDNLRLGNGGRYDSLVESPAQPGFVVAETGALKLSHHPRKEYSANLVPPKEATIRLVTAEVIRNRITTFLQTKPDWVGFLRTLGMDAAMPRMPGLLNGWYHEQVLASGIPLTKALIREIRDEARRNQAVLLASVIPSPLQVYPDVYGPILASTFPGHRLVESYLSDRTRPQRIVADICEELGIPLLDLYPILVQENDKELFIPADGHFSKEGHAIVAQQLAAFVLENAPEPSRTASAP